MKFWLECGRVYSLPITVLNWFAAFEYSLMHGGKIFAGLLALVGISLVHIAANLTDDYFDYKILSKDEKFINSAQNCKCLYLKTGQASVTELKSAIIVFLGCAAVIGAALFFISGYYTAVLALTGLLTALTYQKLSLCGIGELAVFIAFGPLLYEGVYYVMTSGFSADILWLSSACVLFSISILYTHMLMDFDGDECSHKKTLCRCFKTKDAALKFLTVFYVSGFVMITLLSVFSGNYLYFLTFLTAPLIFDLYKSLENFNKNKTNLPVIHFWHYPLDKWKETSKSSDAPFYFRFFYVRNIMIWFIVLTITAMIFGSTNI